MPTVYLDECGFTGEDLAHADSPVFVVASHDFTEEEAKELKERFFGHVRTDELKHTQLQRRAAHHRPVVNFVSAVLATTRIRASVMHKPFALVAKLVDWLVEPVMHADGIDLYDRGGNLALSNALFFVLGAGERPQLQPVTQAFQRAVRTRDPDLIGKCNELLLSPSVQGPLKELGELITHCIARLGPQWISELPPRTLSVSVTVALAVCYAWRRRGLSAFHVVHDRSSAMVRERDVWDVLVAPSAPPALVGNGVFQVDFPIGVQRTLFEDSRAHVSLQLADVIAGAICRWATWLAKGKHGSDAYAAALNDTILEHAQECIEATVWPTIDVSPQPDTPSGVTRSLDYMTRVLASTAR